MSLTETILPNPGLGNWHHAAYREKILFCVGERADARRVAVELFGSPISGRDLAGLAGSPGEAEIELKPKRGGAATRTDTIHGHGMDSTARCRAGLYRGCRRRFFLRKVFWI